MTDFNAKLQFLDTALKYRGISIGVDDGVKEDESLGLLPSKTFEQMEKDRRDLICIIAAAYEYKVKL